MPVYAAIPQRKCRDNPAPTQEAAAELLDTPFSTYRYRLGKAIELIVAWLWRQEVYGGG